MMGQPRSNAIEDNPIGKGLDAFRSSFTSIRADLRNLTLLLLPYLQSLPVAGLLDSKSGCGTLRSDLLKLISAAASADVDFDFDRVKPLLISALADEPDDTLIWDQVYNAVAESTPPPRPVASSIQQTPWLRNTSSFANSSEHRKYVDDVLKEELGPMYVGLRNFHETYFGDVPGLGMASDAFFKQCQEGSNPLFDSGWGGWPEDAKQDDVLSWFADFSEKLTAFAQGNTSIPTRQRRPLAKPNEPIDGSIGKRKMYVGFVNDAEAKKDSRCHWSQILVPGELKSNRSSDKASDAWLDLGRFYHLRVSHEGMVFVFTILGFLWMNEEQLGFDPTIMTANKERFIEIKRNGMIERIIIDEVMQRARCIAGRATTCWKAHREGQPEIPLVIKDSWQYSERHEEGDLLREVTRKCIVNVARYYHHETVQICGEGDDIRSNVRGGLDITRAANYQPERPIPPSSIVTSTLRKGRSSTTTSRKRSSSQTGATLPPSKRSCSASPAKAGRTLPNRVHQRVILRDYGKPIYKASSRPALLAALDGCIKGHESLHKAGFLHRDVSINNLMINEDDNNPSWPSFLIDLDLAIKEQRDMASGARGKTGTRAFMAIGALLGEQHSFMHDLESFFWVLFWICVHYDGPSKGRVVPNYDRWNYVDTDELAKLKKGEVSDEGDFIKTAEEYFTSYYQPFVPWVNRLRKVVFPNGRRWEKEDPGLYPRMQEILREAQEDPTVIVMLS
ncbi:hypothetical protein CEP51_016378 [Fusarium floridanum]|uniref:non-specific serine/threonine protein kinase n=1 Tax=Fusarium floridanum TaxID=1325733 RepID=A0A428NRD6_9HYPO|nr:hypothetical protein CEP51_016378 [Fusarium floridanum]